MDQEKYAMVELARALAASGFKQVPDVVAGGSGGGADGCGSLVNVLLATLIRDGLKPSSRQEPSPAGAAEPDDPVRAGRSRHAAGTPLG